MAVTSGDFLTQLCEEFLSCDICQEDFDAHTHSPRILPCFHSFCAKCLSQLSEGGKVKCPKCRAVTSVEERIPTDTTRLALLDFKQAISKEGPGCEGCREGGRATARCQECEEYLCDSCCQIHGKVNLTRNHSLVFLSEAKQAPAKLVQVSFKCERHADKKLELFCSTCEKAVCVICSQTMHRNCKEIMELDSILDDKKKELVTLCETLERLEGGFSSKVEESEACLQEVDTNLREGESQVVTTFTCMFSALLERQALVLEQLRAKAKADRLDLEGQAATFRSLTSAAQTTAQYGRRVLALGLAPQLLDQKMDIEKTAEELGEKSAACVQPAPIYNFEIAAEKLEELKAVIENFGVCESFPRDVSMAKDVKKPHVSCPQLSLDAKRCSPACQVSTNGSLLSNKPSLHGPAVSESEVYKFPGTCSAAPVSVPHLYWQVRCLAEPKPEFKEKKVLCEVGMATQQALQAWPGKDFLSKTEHSAITVGLGSLSGQVQVGGYRNGQSLTVMDLASSSPDKPVDQTLGFLLNSFRQRLHILDVGTARLLWSRDVDLSSPLWPVLRANTEDFCGGSVQMELQSGQQVEMGEGLARLLQMVLAKDSH